MKNKYFYEMKMGYLNFISIILLIIMLFITLLVSNIDFSFSSFEWSMIMILLIPYLMFHEVLHSIGYVINGADFKKVTYGMHLEKGVLCCSCKQEVNKKCILWSLIYPFLFIGVITYIIGIIINSKILVMLSICNITGCSGDLIMFLDFLKLKKFNYFEYDNPVAFGIITDENLDNKKLAGLKLIEENNFKQTINKKIDISKTSIIIFIAYIIICLINMVL